MWELTNLFSVSCFISFLKMIKSFHLFSFCSVKLVLYPLWCILKAQQSESWKEGRKLRKERSQADPLSRYVRQGKVKLFIPVQDWCDPVAGWSASRQLTGTNMLDASPNPSAITMLL